MLWLSYFENQISEISVTIFTCRRLQTSSGWLCRCSNGTEAYLEGLQENGEKSNIR